MLVPTSIILTFLLCRTLLALQCEETGTCVVDTTRYANKRGFAQVIRKPRPGFRKMTSTESSPKDDVKSQYESLLKSMNDMQDMFKNNQNSARVPTNRFEEVDEREYKPALDRGQCSAWAVTNAAALIRASKYGNVRKIASLVFVGTPVDALDESGGGRTPLHWAVSNGKFAAAKQLLELGASVNRPVPGVSNTPLHIAASSGDLEMVQLLVEYGADMTALNSHCFTPLELSNLHAHHEVSQWMQENAERYVVCKEKKGIFGKLVPPEQETTSVGPLSSHATSTSASPLENSTVALTSLSTEHHVTK